MRALWGAYWQIIVLRAGPDSLPPSRLLLAITVLAYFVISALYGLFLAPVSLEKILIAELFDIGLLTLSCLAVLRFKSLTERWLQTLSALMGASVLLAVVGLPLAIMRVLVEQDSSYFVFVQFAFVIFIAWNLTVRGFIFFRAFNIGPILANFMSFALFIISTVMIEYWLFVNK